MILYLIKSAVCMLLLLGVYHLLLEREKMHRFNRYFLIVSLIFSLTIPLITIHTTSPLKLSNHIDEINSRLSAKSPSPTTPGYVPEVMPDKNNAMSEPAPDSSQFYLFAIAGIYGIISLILGTRLFRNLYLLCQKISRNPYASYQDATLILVENCTIPHSFFNYIFVDQKLYKSGQINEAVFTHELTHLRQKHSLDILFIELLKVVFWFNPVLYFCKRAMQMNHEFLADEAVIDTTSDVPAYQKLLLKLQSGEQEIQLASSIQFSITKKRMIMMTKKSTRLNTVSKQLALIPLLAMLVFAFSTRAVTAQNLEQMSLTELMDAVEAKIESVNDLTDNDKEELNRLINKIQKELKFQVPPPPIPKLLTKKDTSNLEMMTKEYNRWEKSYLEITPIPENKEILDNSYANIVALNKLVDQTQDSVNKKDLPAPPIPISPAERIEARSEKSPPTPQPPEEISKRNLLRILINKEGLLLMDEEPVPVDKVKAKVKEFITNNGADPELSESPKQVVISIKTADNTPYGVYSDILNEVKKAYLEDRDAAAQKEFGVNYSELEKGSAAQKKIQNMYPEQISIKKSDNPK